MGIEPEAALDDPNARQLKFSTSDAALDIVCVRSFDVATIVAFGGAELGVAGNDVLMEFDYPEIYAPVDLGVEKRNGDFVRGLISQGKVTACHDVSDGGILVAVAEMALSGSIGATLQIPDSDIPAHAWLFGEDQGRYIVTTTDAKGLLAAADKAGVPAMQIGITGADGLSLIGGEAETALEELRQTHEGWLPDYMAGP
ncbi:MAG: hypothetical protein IH926_05810 [Proteobacteria bacterium]|nr:hypothetical protein [Pseudomonadota bacterium]